MTRTKQASKKGKPTPKKVESKKRVTPKKQKSKKFEIDYLDNGEIAHSFVIVRYDPKKLENRSDIITTKKEITIQIDYPLGQAFNFKVKSKNGFTLGKFIRSVVNIYRKIYKDEEKAIGYTPTYAEAGGKLWNRMPSSGPYKIWGHVLGDLYFEGIHYKNGKYMLHIGS